MRVILLALLLVAQIPAQLTVDVQPVPGSRFASGCGGFGRELVIDSNLLGTPPQELWLRFSVGLQFQPYDVLYVIAPPQPATPVIGLGPGWAGRFDWFGVNEYASFLSNRRTVVRVPGIQPFSAYVQALSILPAAPPFCPRAYFSVTTAFEVTVM